MILLDLLNCRWTCAPADARTNRRTQTPAAPAASLLKVFSTLSAGAIAIAAVSARAAVLPPPVRPLLEAPAEALFSVENGTIELAEMEGAQVLRWHINTGQTSHLALRKDHPLFAQLRYYDRLQCRYRIASGEISALKLNAVGHVNGPRQYKVHNFRIAIVTTPREVWLHEELDLARPYWFPWDDPDGEGEDGYFRFEAMATADDTVIELADPRLVRGLIYLKPDYELPVTWPVLTRREDGAATYTLEYKVLNASGRPADITARIVSPHQRFDVSLNQQSESVKAGKVASFTVTAEIGAAEMAAAPELYQEPLRVEFAPKHRPDATTVWMGRLVKPLTSLQRRQVVIAQDDLAALRRAVAEQDAELLRAIDYDTVLAQADAFVEKTLQTVPRSYSHVCNRYPHPWRPGDIMSEAVNTETGERRIGDELAGRVWREYLAYSGQASYYTGLAYALSRDEKYALKALELMRLYAEQYAERKWHNLFDPPYFRGEPIQASSRLASNSSYGSNWDFKWICEMISLVADSPSWTDEDRRFIYEKFVLPYATELAKLPGLISNQTDITNHNLLLLGIVFDDAYLVWIATQRDCGLVSRLRDIDEDGFSSEGRPLNYHYAAASEYLPSVTHLENSGLAVDYGKERILEAMRMPFARATLTGQVPNAGDCGRGQRVGPVHLADILVGIAPEQEWLLDIGRNSTLSAKLRNHEAGRTPRSDSWRSMLETSPRLFRQAGLAILRSGDTAEEQVMLTLDYGRSVFHGALDRNQITLSAFGKIFTHGPGTRYNAGRGGIQYNDDPRLLTFDGGRVSLAHNVIVVDRISLRNCIGRLLAWSPRPDFQAAVSRVDGIQPGVAHTRGVVLTRGVVIMLDRVESEDEHLYDNVYHNFGELTLGQGWSGSAAAPLGDTGNYDNVVDPQQLSGDGVFRANWDLTRQYPYWRENNKVDEATLPPIRLAFWRLPVAGATLYSGVTGLNNCNTGIMSDRAPTIIHRVRARNAEFATVLEPYKTDRRVSGLEQAADGAVRVTFTEGDPVVVSLEQLIERFEVQP